ncbi:MAG: sterol desaturase family protein [Bacteroidetes bacterium]|nr:sterol desaturase family protein [Bacteroidota bacterium]
MERYWGILFNVSTRYFLIAGIAFLVCYKILYPRIAGKKIQSKLPGNEDYLREIGYSVVTIMIFALVPYFFVFNPTIRSYTRLYSEISERGWIYYWLAFPLMILIHDTYFYWTHRIMHTPGIYRWFHATHHASTNPSPWAAYAFHPLEALVEVGIFPLFLFTLPMHRTHFFLFFLFSIVYNVYGHLGWEIYPKRFMESSFGKWINTATAHNFHHRFFNGNYGLYLKFWDRIMGTLR